MDRAISRIHCKIIYEDGFRVKRSMPKSFLTFLMMRHPRVGVKSYGRNLPVSIYRKIYAYIKSLLLAFLLTDNNLEPYKFWITDLGSVFGSYLRLTIKQKSPLNKGEIYLIGSESLFYITEVHNYGLEDMKRKKQ